MKIIIFTEGTILMHRAGIGCSREERVKQVEEEEQSVHDFSSYVAIGNAVKTLKDWTKQSAKIFYLTSRTKKDEIEAIRDVLKKHKFPEGELLYRKRGQGYKDIVESIVPDVLIEDDCESIGGEKETTITHLEPAIKEKIRSIVVKEFGGLPSSLDK